MSVPRRVGNRALASILLLLLALIPAAAAAQKAVFVVRHAEKQSDKSDPDIPLADVGKQRAARLAAMLKDAGVTAIYSTDTVRTRGTAGPLAEAVRKPIQIYSGIPALVDELRRAPDGVALVVGHSNSVPRILEALGVSNKIEISDDEFDNLFLVIPRGAGEPVFLRLRY